MCLLNSFNVSSYCIEQESDGLKNETLSLSCIKEYGNILSLQPMKPLTIW